ncbi:hypothetical protein GOZ97_17345 [Agrobacterium vitis]|uniref:hypothetical protein n=1 Tax=Rhizobium/Agrobacterium group TaxID=227290 RepID=UPI0008DBF485|nr:MULTISPECIES: hypothetical protein [Rhizobium/Agrobacterium group]MCF1433355.1 hypothetical protein [Allorhizobium ampelinum]MUO91346.1 hypothetical protein [Agrobacterium vitis]MUZ54549.1 hypothetical protein [Agrobacterium vitis]MUZ93192.1 hypothetical protein [Agrobacterium vitis]OHZ36137.1 hypothetical protein BBL07_16715 [Agrobacterium vitis]
MSILETALRERNRLLEQQADQYAGAVDSLSNRLAEALRRLAPHDPDYVRSEAPDLVPAEVLTPMPSSEDYSEAS